MMGKGNKREKEKDMKTFKGIMYDIGIMAATIISLLLMVSLVVNTFLACSKNVLETDNVEELIENMDYYKIISSEIEKSEDVNIQGLDEKVIDEILKTEMMDEIFELCLGNIFAEFEGNRKEITVKEVRRIGNKYSEDIEDLLKEHYEKTGSMTEDQIENIVDNLIETYSETIVEMAPTAESLGLSKEGVEAVSDVKNGTSFWISCGVTVIFSMLVFLILISKLKGLIWLGIDYILTATGILITSFFVDGIVGSLAKGTILSKLDISFVTNNISINMLISSIVIYVIGIMFIVIFIVAKVSKKKRLGESIQVLEPVQPIESNELDQTAEVANEDV